ncbi:MAG: hypothetical protein Ct9H300mP4_08230 [Gammaproteobacteria bacterium]|nr:MAG: hypothetical protein Ct9H300mP4_08230 [Gammaproteobacteria bacterium]
MVSKEILSITLPNPATLFRGYLVVASVSGFIQHCVSTIPGEINAAITPFDFKLALKLKHPY